MNPIIKLYAALSKMCHDCSWTTRITPWCQRVWLNTGPAKSRNPRNPRNPIFGSD